MLKLFAPGRRPPRASVRPADARQGHRRHPGRGADRGLQEAAPGRPAHGRQRARAGHQPLLQLPPLRPGPRRPLQAEQGAGRRRRQAEDRRCPPEASENPRDARVISRNDIVAIIGKLIELNNGRGSRDDIDHLGNRRIRANGELIQNQFRIGLLRMERVVKERMTITDADQATPNTLINIRPVVAAMKEFFGGSQLSPVHGPDQPAGRADQQAAPVGAGPRRPVPRAGRLRRSRRPPLPLRPDVPDRDAGGPEHRPDRLAGDLRQDQRATASSRRPTARCASSSRHRDKQDRCHRAGAGRAAGHR